MVKPTFKVDGMHMDTLAQAETVANRLYERYDYTRSITIYTVDHHGEESVYDILEALNPTEEDTDQPDLF